MSHANLIIEISLIKQYQDRDEFTQERELRDQSSTITRQRLSNFA